MPWNLGQTNKKAYPFWVRRFNVSLFTVGTKVLYVDHNDSNAVRDTGITLTDGTTTRMVEFGGQVLLTNQTDGQRLIVFTKLNDAAANAGDATVTVDIDGGARMDRFDTALAPGTKNLRIRGTNEQYASVATGTGVVTLSGTLSQAYPDNVVAVVVYDISSSRPKASKLVAWLNYIHSINASEQDASSSSDVPPSSMGFTDAITAATIEKLVAWTGGTSGTELVGKGGILTNAIATNNNLYLFKEDMTFRIPVTSVNKSTGARPPEPFLDNEGCANEDSAVNMGSDVVFATRSGRVLRIRYANSRGSDVEQLDNSFDDDILEELQDLQPNYYTNCHMHYDVGERLVYFQARFQGGEVKTMVYENRPIYDDEGNVLSEGRWLPPDKGKNFRLYFNIGKDLYATASNDDTIYKLNEGTTDESADFECLIAPGKFEPGSTCMWKDIEVTGGIDHGSTITFTPYVNSTPGEPKTITSTQIGSASSGVGNVAVGDGAEQEVSDGKSDFERTLLIYPSRGKSFQPVFSTFGNGHGMRIDSYKISATAYPRGTTTAQ